MKRSRRGAVLFIQPHLIDSVVGSRLGRLGVFQLVIQGPTQCRRRWSSAEEAQNAQTTTRRSHQAHQHLQQIARNAMVVSKITRGFPQHTPFFFLAITCSCCYCNFQPPSFNPCRISHIFFRENMKLHISREQIKKGPYLHFWAPPVQWWGQSRKLDNFFTT